MLCLTQVVRESACVDNADVLPSMDTSVDPFEDSSMENTEDDSVTMLLNQYTLTVSTNFEDGYKSLS